MLLTERLTGADEPVGTLRRARQLFADELARLDVVLDRRAALDDLLAQMVDQFDVSRQSLLKNYVSERTVAELARRAATDATGFDAAVLTARQLVAQEYPESTDWPALVRNYLIDHLAVRTGAETLARLFLGEKAEIKDAGLFQFRYGLSDGLAMAIHSERSKGLIPLVTMQDRSLVDQRSALRANSQWGRPEFDWAYELMLSTYRRRTGLECDRLIWAWADAAMVAAGHFPELAGVGARRLLAGTGSPGQVMVVARVPAERCLFTSHILWDALVLRGRYIPYDLKDALAFHAAHGSCLLDNDAASQVNPGIFDSWRERFFGASPDPTDVRLQVCIDRVDPDEIVDVIEVDDHGLAELPWMVTPGVRARPIGKSDSPF